MLGPTAREERLREERQKTATGAVRSLARGYVRQSAIDAALEKQRKDRIAAGFPEAGTRRGFDSMEEAAKRLTSEDLAQSRRDVREGDWDHAAGMPMGDDTRGATRALVAQMPMMDPALRTPVDTAVHAGPLPGVPTTLQLDPPEHEVRSALAVVDQDIAEGVAASEAAEAMARRELGARWPESYEGAATRFPSTGEHRADRAAGADRLAKVERSRQSAGSRFDPSGYAVMDESGERYRGAPGSIAQMFDEAGRIERIGKPIEATSTTQMVADETIDENTSPEMLSAWERWAESGAGGTLEEGKAAWNFAAAQRGDQWYMAFIRGETGASQQVIDEFVAQLRLADVEYGDGHAAGFGQVGDPWRHSSPQAKAARRALYDNVRKGDLYMNTGMPKGDDPGVALEDIVRQAAQAIQAIEGQQVTRGGS